MKYNEKKLLLSTTVSIAFIFILSLLVITSIYNFDISTPLKIGLVLFVATIFIFLIYIVMYFILVPSFKANHLLELLLKDTLHELNIPLCVIKANLQILRLDETKSKTLKRLDRIEMASLDLDRLYRDVDYYIKREVRYDLKEEFDIKEVIDNEIEKVRAQYLHITIITDGNSLHVRADKHGFTKVIGNIINNAIKYNKNNNNITITLKNTRLSIKDSGIGMSESDVFKIFDRYYQGNAQTQGFGIGLSIVKAYCDEEKIFINISSKETIGTKITLDLKNILVTKEA